MIFNDSYVSGLTSEFILNDINSDGKSKKRMTVEASALVLMENGNSTQNPSRLHHHLRLNIFSKRTCFGHLSSHWFLLDVLLGACHSFNLSSITSSRPEPDPGKCFSIFTVKYKRNVSFKTTLSCVHLSAQEPSGNTNCTNKMYNNTSFPLFPTTLLMSSHGI